jgi:hypothetical protein
MFVNDFRIKVLHKRAIFHEVAFIPVRDDNGRTRK